MRSLLDQPEGGSIPDCGKSMTESQGSEGMGSLGSQTRRHMRVSGRGKGQCWRGSRARVMGAPPTRLRRPDFIQLVMGSIRSGGATFHKDPSGGSVDGAEGAVGRMKGLSRPEAGLTVDG